MPIYRIYSQFSSDTLQLGPSHPSQVSSAPPPSGDAAGLWITAEPQRPTECEKQNDWTRLESGVSDLRLLSAMSRTVPCTSIDLYVVVCSLNIFRPTSKAHWNSVVVSLTADLTNSS